MEQENLGNLNKTCTPKRKISTKDNNIETPNKSSSKKNSSCSSSSARCNKKKRDEYHLNNNSNHDNAVISTPEIGIPEDVPYMLRSKKRELIPTDSNIRKKNLIMPPLNLKNKELGVGKSSFFDTENRNNENSDLLIYSTPRKKGRESNDLRICEDENNINDRELKSSSRRKSNIKCTPVTSNRKNGDEDSAIKDRRSILKQYDPDNANTSNIKTPKSQKKVQFGVKNLIIINESKQNADINSSVVSNSNSIQINNCVGTQDLNGRISILSELDDTSTGNIYNFPSLEELIKNEDNKNKNEDFNNHSIHLDKLNDNKTINQSDSKNADKNVLNNSNKDYIGDKNDKSVDINDKINIQNDVEDNLDITDQINISDYSINCRDSITPNIPGAFLSVVMKNLSSVNFTEEDHHKNNKSNNEDIKDNKEDMNFFEEKEIKGNEEVINEEKVNEPKINVFEKINSDKNQIKYQEMNKFKGTVNEKVEGGVSKADNGKNDFNIEIEKVGDNLELENQNVDLILNNDDKNSINLIENTPLVDLEKKESDNAENQIVEIEILDLLKDSNRLSEVSITPVKNDNFDYINDKLSPSSRYLLDSLNNTKSILNIVPQGYTWEEFQSLLNLNYTMDNFNMLDFEEFDDKNNEVNKELVNQIQEIIKENDSDDDDNKVLIFKYVGQLVKSLKSLVWEEIERNKLVQLYTDDIYENKYKKNLLKFSDSEIATVLAIIVNKSRYGNKNDETIKNELLIQISKYFFDDEINVFSKKSWIDWKERIIFPYKKLLIQKYEEQIKKFTNLQETITNNKNRIKNSYVLLSTIESCQISEMHVYETYWNAMKIVHENINNYREEISRMKNYINTMMNKKKNLIRLINKEQEFSNTLILELNNWKNKKNTLKNNLNSLRIKEDFAGFTWDLFTINKFQTLVILNSNGCNYIKTRISIEWNIDQNQNIITQNESDSVKKSDSPILLNIELDNPKSDDISLVKEYDSRINENNIHNQKLEIKIYQNYIDIIKKTLNSRLIELYNNYKRQKKMNNSILIELIRGIFQSSIVLLWRLESIVFEILNVMKVFNLAIIDVIENKLIMNIPILIGLNYDEKQNENQKLFSSNSSPLLTSPSTPNSLSNLSPHLLMSSRPIISITFNMTNSLFKSIGTLVNSIEDMSVYNTNDEISQDMNRVFNNQIKEINQTCKKNSAIYVGYNCLLSIIQNTIQEGGHNQLVWKRPLEKFAPRLLNAVQISKLHQNY